MSHRTLCLLAVAVLLPGCVPVTEPLSDPAKAEPDKRLLGPWQRSDPTSRCEIDSPVVKGHPKGLMRAVLNGRADDRQNAFWFFTTSIGKHTYATIYLDEGDELRFADFRGEGAFAKWHQGNNRRYFIFQYALEGNNLTVDGGDKEAVQKLMKAEKIAGGNPNSGGNPYFSTPPEWLANYLAKNGPQVLYNGTNVQQWRRVEK